MADLQQPNVPAVTVQGEPQGEPSIQPKDSGETNEGSSVDFQKLLKERDGTISSLTKKLDSTTSEIQQLKEGLKVVAGVVQAPVDNGETDTASLIAGLKSRVDSLQKEKLVDQTISNLIDEEGNPLPDSIKKRVRDAVDLDSLPLEKVQTAIAKQAGILFDVYQDTKLVANKQPESETRSYATFRSDTPIRIVR